MSSNSVSKSAFRTTNLSCLKGLTMIQTMIINKDKLHHFSRDKKQTCLKFSSITFKITKMVIMELRTNSNSTQSTDFEQNKEYKFLQMTFLL